MRQSAASEGQRPATHVNENEFSGGALPSQRANANELT